MQIPRANLNNMLNAISNGNHVFNEQIKLYKNTKTDCPDCDIDPVRKESTDPYCQTCNGTGYIIVEHSFDIPASVETEEDFKYDFSKAGKFVKGQIYLTLDIKEINEILNASNTYDLDDHSQLKQFIESYDYVVWKGAKYDINEFEPGWLEGTLYEIGCMLSLME